MKRAGIVLGIIGSAIGILIGFYYIFIFIATGTLDEKLDNFLGIKEFIPEIYLLPVILLFCVFAGSSLGLAGALVSRNKPGVGGLLMLTGAILNLADIIGFIFHSLKLDELFGFPISMLLLLGGIFALIPEKTVRR